MIEAGSPENPEFVAMVGVAYSGDLFSAFQGWNYKQASLSTQDLCGFLGIWSPILMLVLQVF